MTNVNSPASADLLKKAQSINWQQQGHNLQLTRFRPLYDRKFTELKKKLWSQGYSRIERTEKDQFLLALDKWLQSSSLNVLKGLESFARKELIHGCTQWLDDLHIRFSDRLVIIDKEYSYHQKLRSGIKVRTVETLSRGDVLVLSAPFPWFGGTHPLTEKLLQRCLELEVPVFIDAAWFGCVKDFHFDFSHPAIHEVAFSLSKGLGLGDNRIGLRYAHSKSSSNITVMNEYDMEIESAIYIGQEFIKSFSIDYLQNRYGEAYKLVCENLNLQPSGAIHTAFMEKDGNLQPVGIRPFLRFLVDDINELST